MATTPNDYTIENKTASEFRAELNEIIELLVTNNADGSEPNTTFANMWWADTSQVDSNGVGTVTLKIRDSENANWITFATLDSTNGTFISESSALSDTLKSELIDEVKNGFTTDDLTVASGSSNIFYADSLVQDVLKDSIATGETNLVWDDTNKKFSLTGLFNSSDVLSVIQTITTDSIAEGTTRKYYSDTFVYNKLKSLLDANVGSTNINGLTLNWGNNSFSYSHAPIGSGSTDTNISVDESAGHVITGITVDTYGHVKSVSSEPKTNIDNIPAGMIMMWSKSIIPSGWALCDGSNGTPNLVDKFIMATSSPSNLNTTGGSNTVTLGTSNLPSHTHVINATVDSGGSHAHSAGTLKTNQAGNHTHRLKGGDNNPGWTGQKYAPLLPHDDAEFFSTDPNSVEPSGTHSHTITGGTATAGSHTHTISGSTSATGSSSPISVVPSHYKLYFIIKL